MTGGIDHELLKQLPGGPDLIAWFGGCVPSFHDAEIVELALDRVQSCCRIKIHAFERTPETYATGHYVCVKHVVVTLRLLHVMNLQLDDFNHQNALDYLGILRQPNGNILLTMEPCYGLGGEIEAMGLEISLEPGIPPDSVYAERAAGTS